MKHRDPLVLRVGVLLAVCALLVGCGHVIIEVHNSGQVATPPSPTPPDPAAGPTDTAVADNATVPPSPAPAKFSTPAPTTPASPATISGGPIQVVEQFKAPPEGAQGIAWDGLSLWLTTHSAKIFSVDTSGKVLAVYQAPDASPEGLTWSGASLWVFSANYSLIYECQLRGPKLQSLRSFKSPNDSVGGTEDDLAWDGSSLWYVDQYNLYRLSTEGEILNVFAFPEEIKAVDWDGQHLWLAHGQPSSPMLSVVDRDGTVLRSLTSPVPSIYALTWGDGSLWALAGEPWSSDVTVYRLDVGGALR